MRTRVTLLGVCVAAVLTAGGAPALAAAKTATDLGGLVNGNSAFALDLYGRLRAKKGNLFFSPYSISTALAMTYGGARGKTETQMARTLHFALAQGSLHPAFAALERNLKADPKEAGYELHVANRLWGRKGHAWLPSFLGLTRKHYGAGLEELNFRGDPEGSRKTINTWVERQTKDKIKELLKKGIITHDTALVLTNAIYFKGDWASQFDEKKTKDAPFGVVPPRAITRLPRVPLMYRKGDFRHARLKGLQVLELPYKGKQLSMFVLLPAKQRGADYRKTFAQFEKSLTPKNLSAWLKKLRTEEVRVYLPKFKMTSEFKLNEVLKGMGMTDAFRPYIADFTGMRKTAKHEGLHISAVVHKAFVDVNEEGTEAAAATAVVMEDRAYHPPVIFRADHPFLFLIRHNKTRTILFLGRVVNPKK